MSYQSKSPNELDGFMDEMSKYIDPWQADDAVLKPEVPHIPALKEYREARRADDLNLRSLFIAEQAKRLRQCAEGDPEAEQQFKELIALKAEMHQQQAAMHAAAICKSGADRARKARRSLGIVLAEAASGKDDPYAAATAKLYGLKEGDKAFGTKRRNIEREVERFIEHNVADMFLPILGTWQSIELMVFFALLQTRIHVAVAQTLMREIKSRQSETVRSEIKRRYHNGSLFKLLMTEEQRIGGGTPNSPEAEQGLSWLLGEIRRFVDRQPKGRKFKSRRSSPLAFENVFLSRLAGGA